ncbi:MAG: trimethylamine methyltransferase family protein, partial [Promethearchaeota archaeon]
DGLEEIPELVQLAGPGGNYLKEKHTRKYLRNEHIFPSDAIDRLSLDAWIESGSRESKDLAKGRVDDLLGKHQPQSLPADRQEQMNSIMREVISRHRLDGSTLLLHK